MADLIVYLPGHGYSDDTPVYLSWLDYNGYVTDPQADSFKVDDGAGSNVQYTETVTDGYVREYDATSGTSTITGLEHLEGLTVKVTSGGEVIGSYTVSSGSVTVPVDIYNYQVGLPYKMRVRTMRLSVPQEGNTLQSRIKRISEIVVRYIRTKLGKSGVEYNDTAYTTALTTTYSDKSQDDTKLARGGMTDDAYVVVSSDDPMPMTVLSTIISFEVEERR